MTETLMRNSFDAFVRGVLCVGELSYQRWSTDGCIFLAS